MSDKTVWLVRATTATTGEDIYEIIDTAESLGDYVRVNAEDSCTYLIRRVDKSTLAHDWIAQDEKEAAP